jgi:hypothetical protein
VAMDVVPAMQSVVAARGVVRGSLALARAGARFRSRCGALALLAHVRRARLRLARVRALGIASRRCGALTSFARVRGARVARAGADAHFVRAGAGARYARLVRALASLVRGGPWVISTP